jgi:phospholipase D-like protein
LDTAIWIAVGVLHLVALVDIWTSQLTRTARVLWSLTLLFLPGIGMVAWLLTRHSAHGPLEEIPEQESEAV